jgi:N-acetylmuramoyl-L-alanine amidase
MLRKIDKIIIHCSASDNRQYDFDAIYNDHVNVNGWSDIGYHLGVDFDGNYELLRPLSRIGAHCKGKNSSSIGICVLGLSLISFEQKRRLANLVAYLLDWFDLSIDDVYGHYEFNKNKTCPNFDMEEFKVSYLKDAICLYN